VTVLIVILYVLVCIFLVLVVLLQQGKGADLAGAFGGGGSQSSFGPRTQTNIMHRLTTISFILFVVLSMGLAILSGKSRGSVMQEVAPQPTVVATPAVGPSEQPEAAPAQPPAESSGTSEAPAEPTQPTGGGQ
jgi:preprotein translocase subunit SecG